MRPWTWIWLAGALGLALAQDAASTPRERAGLAGPVASYVEEAAYPDVGVDRRVESEWRYDEAGELVEGRAYQYDLVSGALRAVTTTRFGPGASPLVGETVDPDGAVLGQTVYRYDEQGRRVEQVSYDAAGAITLRTVVTFDASGARAREETYRGGSLSGYVEIETDARGEPVTRRRFTAGGDLRSERTYAEGGRAWDETDYRDGAVTGRQVTRFDDDGNLVERVEVDADGVTVSELRRTFDERGWLVEEVDRQVLDGRVVETVTVYLYEVDPQGNWVVRRRFEAPGGRPATNGAPTEVRTRTLTYY